MPRKAVVAGDPKRAIAYLRVSTDKQEHGPEAQRAALTAWAARSDVQIVDWIEEKESGATTVEDRPELQKALEALSTNGAGVLLAAKRDRVAREMTIARDIAAHARKHGAVVITADGMSDTEGRPDSFLKQGISDLFAEHERRQIADRTRTALAVMRAKGLRTGKPPYGWQPGSEGPPSKKSQRPLTLVPCEAEQAVWALVARLHACGASERQIETELASRGVLSRKGHRLAQTQIHRIVVKSRNEPTPKHTLRCPVRPLNLEANVDLYSVIVPWGAPSSSYDIEPVCAALAAHRMELDVVHIERVLSTKHLSQLKFVARKAEDWVQGGGEHARLAALGSLYLESLGKTPRWNGDYNGGRADVSASDGSMVVECGTLNPRKVMSAMDEGIALLVLPYNLGCDMPDDDLRKYALPNIEPLPEVPAHFKEEYLRALDRATLGSVNLGYVFKPSKPTHVAACGRGHAHHELNAAAVREGKKFCTEGECGREKGQQLPVRVIRWVPAS